MNMYDDYKEYLFECDYYDSWEDKEIHACALIMAPSMHEAVEAIEKRLPYCHNLHITQYDEYGFVWMSQKHYDRLSKQDEPYMFDEEEYPEVIIEKCGVDEPDHKLQIHVPNFAEGVQIACDKIRKITDDLNRQIHDIPVTEEEDAAWNEYFKDTIDDMTYNEEPND